MIYTYFLHKKFLLIVTKIFHTLSWNIGLPWLYDVIKICFRKYNSLFHVSSSAKFLFIETYSSYEYNSRDFNIWRIKIWVGYDERWIFKTKVLMLPKFLMRLVQEKSSCKFRNFFWIKPHQFYDTITFILFCKDSIFYQKISIFIFKKLFLVI